VISKEEDDDGRGRVTEEEEHAKKKLKTKGNLKLLNSRLSIKLYNV